MTHSSRLHCDADLPFPRLAHLELVCDLGIAAGEDDASHLDLPSSLFSSCLFLRAGSCGPALVDRLLHVLRLTIRWSAPPSSARS